jgi:rRNA maturation protein Rpf1
MTYQKKFASSDGKIFVVNEVIQTPVGLTVYYTNEKTQEQYSCLIDAFSERFQEIQND